MTVMSPLVGKNSARAKRHIRRNFDRKLELAQRADRERRGRKHRHVYIALED